MLEKILVKDLNVFYGNKQALENINLEIGNGMFGLLGRNGAGKSTLMKSLVTLLPIKSGSIDLCGVDIKEVKKIRKMVGYLPQDFNIYPNMKVIEALDYLATMSNMKGEDKKIAVRESLKTVNLWNDRNKKVKSLSGGMKRRLGIAQAIVHSPRVLIVDEPTAGLDPEERIRFRNLLANIAKKKIVILSTHIVGDIESTCEKVAVLNNGRIIFNDTVKNLINRAASCTYTASIPRQKYNEYNEKYLITSHHDNETEIIIKLISSGKPEDIFKLCEPGIEDGYLSLIYDIGGRGNV